MPESYLLSSTWIIINSVALRPEAGRWGTALACTLCPCPCLCSRRCSSFCLCSFPSLAVSCGQAGLGALALAQVASRLATWLGARARRPSDSDLTGRFCLWIQFRLPLLWVLTAFDLRRGDWCDAIALCLRLCLYPDVSLCPFPHSFPRALCRYLCTCLCLWLRHGNTEARTRKLSFVSISLIINYFNFAHSAKLARSTKLEYVSRSYLLSSIV